MVHLHTHRGSVGLRRRRHAPGHAGRLRGAARVSFRTLVVLACIAPAAACREAPTGTTASPAPVPCLTAVPICSERVEIADRVFLQVYRTHPLLEPDTVGLTRAVIVVHGTNRNADDYFETMNFALAPTGYRQETVVVSPRFQTESDRPASDEARWTSGGWKRGDLSRTSGPAPRVSSYAALDRIMALLTNPERFPGIETIVVTGHSAGGQVAHRYAAASPFESGRHRIRYVVANPSTYLFAGPERPSADTFALPDTLACPDWNDWHYGFGNLNTYAAAAGIDSMVARLTRRDVIVMVGTADTLTSYLDMSCGAMLQGSRRLYRGENVVAFMDAFFGEHGHDLARVPFVGHSSRGMYSSGIGRSALTPP